MFHFFLSFTKIDFFIDIFCEEGTPSFLLENRVSFFLFFLFIYTTESEVCESKKLEIFIRFTFYSFFIPLFFAIFTITTIT